MTSNKLIFLLSILLSVVGTKALAYDIEVNNADGVTIYYNYINDGKELEVTYRNEDYNSYRDVVVIPDEVIYMNRTRKVTNIGENAFYNCGLTSVTIPNSVASIGKGAFSFCNGLTSVTIPNSVTSIGENAFYYCIGLTSVTIGNSVTKIGESAFYNCGLTSVTIPNSVTSIESSAFHACNGLTSVTIPNSVTKIGDYAFFYCGGLTSVTISNSVASIGQGTFCNCIALAFVTIPNSVTSIESYAFSGCKGLTSITIPNSVTKIGESAFYNCGLTSVTIPNSVTSIELSTFDGCDLSEVISKIENPFDINLNTFSDNTFYNATLYVPAGTIDKYKATEGWKKFLFIEEGSPSSIKNVESEEKMEYRRYTLDGSVLKNSHKGINIILMNNGTTKKVLVK